LEPALVPVSVLAPGQVLESVLAPVQVQAPVMVVVPVLVLALTHRMTRPEGPLRLA